MAAAAADTVAPLLKLALATEQAFHTARYARMTELCGRALAAAEATLPGDSLVVAYLLQHLSYCQTGLAEDVVAAGFTPRFFAANTAAWARDEQALAQAQRSLAILNARWRAGSLLALSPEETAFFVHGLNRPCAATEVYLDCASDAAVYWPALRTPAEEEARVRGVHGALRAALDLHTRGELDWEGRTQQSSSSPAVRKLIRGGKPPLFTNPRWD
jgi:hypothetical protein